MNAFLVDAAYTDFLNKLINVVQEIAPRKEIRINNDTQNGLIEKLLS